MKQIRATLATLLSLIVVFPIFYSLSASFFQYTDFTAYPPRLFPSSFTLENYRRAFVESNLLTYLGNSLVSAAAGTLLRMTISIIGAYAFTFLSFRGKDFLFILIVSTMLLPADALILQNYTTIRQLRLTDTYLGIVSTNLLAPAHLFMLRQYFKTISREYHEAALIEGCADGRFLMTLLVPMSKAVIITLALHSFSTIFNDYLWPLLVTNQDSMRTVQVGLTMLGFSENLDYGPQFAAITLLLTPLLITFIALHKPIQESVSTRFSGR